MSWQYCDPLGDALLSTGNLYPSSQYRNYDAVSTRHMPTAKSGAATYLSGAGLVNRRVRPAVPISPNCLPPSFFDDHALFGGSADAGLDDFSFLNNNNISYMHDLDFGDKKLGGEPDNSYSKNLTFKRPKSFSPNPFQPQYYETKAAAEVAEEAARAAAVLNNDDFSAFNGRNTLINPYSSRGGGGRIPQQLPVRNGNTNVNGGGGISSSSNKATGAVGGGAKNNLRLNLGGENTKNNKNTNFPFNNSTDEDPLNLDTPHIRSHKRLESNYINKIHHYYDHTPRTKQKHAASTNNSHSQPPPSNNNINSNNNNNNNQSSRGTHKSKSPKSGILKTTKTNTMMNQQQPQPHQQQSHQYQYQQQQQQPHSQSQYQQHQPYYPHQQQSHYPTGNNMYSNATGSSTGIVMDSFQPPNVYPPYQPYLVAAAPSIGLPYGAGGGGGIGGLVPPQPHPQVNFNTLTSSHPNLDSPSQLEMLKKMQQTERQMADIYGQTRVSLEQQQQQQKQQQNLPYGTNKYNTKMTTSYNDKPDDDYIKKMMSKYDESGAANAIGSNYDNQPYNSEAAANNINADALRNHTPSPPPQANNRTLKGGNAKTKAANQQQPKHHYLLPRKTEPDEGPGSYLNSLKEARLREQRLAKDKYTTRDYKIYQKNYGFGKDFLPFESETKMEKMEKAKKREDYARIVRERNNAMLDQHHHHQNPYEQPAYYGGSLDLKRNALNEKRERFK